MIIFILFFGIKKVIFNNYCFAWEDKNIDIMCMTFKEKVTFNHMSKCSPVLFYALSMYLSDLLELLYDGEECLFDRQDVFVYADDAIIEIVPFY